LILHGEGRGDRHPRVAPPSRQPQVAAPERSSVLAPDDGNILVDVHGPLTVRLGANSPFLPVTIGDLAT
jgi:hypothetical protein